MCNIGQHCAALQSRPGHSGSVSLSVPSAGLTGQLQHSVNVNYLFLSPRSHLLFKGNSMKRWEWVGLFKICHRQNIRHLVRRRHVFVQTNSGAFRESIM